MKIEMGESLFYSWLRHVKECQIAQTNWKVSSRWNLKHEPELEEIFSREKHHFERNRGYKIFKQNASLNQVIQQGECDVLGVSIGEDGTYYYAVDVAFHEAGLNYGTKDDTIMKVVSKCIRTAICLYGYFDATAAEIIFASPKVNPAILNELSPCLKEANAILDQLGYHFVFRLIANEEFNDAILQPILLASQGIADTSELFVRSYQMYRMFATDRATAAPRGTLSPAANEQIKESPISEDSYREFKVGKLAQVVLCKLLEDGKATPEEIQFMQTPHYSKQFFGLNYPLLVKADEPHDPVRYYSRPLNIGGIQYKLCSQWFETPANNDRPYLIKWIHSHE